MVISVTVIVNLNHTVATATSDAATHAAVSKYMPTLQHGCFLRIGF